MRSVVRDWNEEVMKWLAVGICLAMVGLPVVPNVVAGDAAKYGNGNWNADAGLIWDIGMGVNGAILAYAVSLACPTAELIFGIAWMAGTAF